MKYGEVVLVVACFVAFSPAQEKTDEGPTNEKARKAYNEGLEYLRQRMKGAALDAFKKADKQDGWPAGRAS
jgi:outer membrane protein assembly factor BamD (BamD/ComL family)